jgi:hypothetical protein
VIAAVVLLATAGCSGDDQCSSPVPAETYECFSGGAMPEGAVQEGLIEIGTGREAFEPLVPEQGLQLMHGIQGGFHFEIRTRIQGLDGGEPGNTAQDENPTTLLTAYNEAGERLDGATCGFFVAYEPAEGAEEYDDLPTVRLLIFGLDTRPVDGQRVRVVAEILDRCGGYASGEVWVVTDD